MFDLKVENLSKCFISVASQPELDEHYNTFSLHSYLPVILLQFIWLVVRRTPRIGVRSGDGFIRSRTARAAPPRSLDAFRKLATRQIARVTTEAKFIGTQRPGGGNRRPRNNATKQINSGDHDGGKHRRCWQIPKTNERALVVRKSGSAIAESRRNFAKKENTPSDVPNRRISMSVLLYFSCSDVQG